MKRIFALILAAAMLTALFCACGNDSGKTGGTVTTTVKAKYDDGYAKQYADSTKTDENGNTVYEFSGDKYDNYLKSHNNTVSKNIQQEIGAKHDKSYGEFVYLDNDRKAVVVGIHEGKFDEKVAKEEAKSAAEDGFKYFQSLQTPVDTISVIYCNANDQSQVFGTFEFTAE